MPNPDKFFQNIQVGTVVELWFNDPKRGWERRSLLFQRLQWGLTVDQASEPGFYLHGSRIDMLVPQYRSYAITRLQLYTQGEEKPT